MLKCQGCNEKFNEHETNVRALVCDNGCLIWFHNYPKKCMRIWIMKEMGIETVLRKLQSKKKKKMKKKKHLRKLGLDKVTRILKCPCEGCNAEIHRLVGGIWNHYGNPIDWDMIDTMDYKYLEKFKDTVPSFQTGLIGKTIERIWIKYSGQSDARGRYYSLRYTNWTRQDNKPKLLKAKNKSVKFEKQVKLLMSPEVYHPERIALPEFKWYKT